MNEIPPERVAHPPEANGRGAPHGRDCIVLALAAFALYVALGQQAFYSDAQDLMQRLGGGRWRHEKHYLYLPITHVPCALLAPFGVSTYHAARLASALGCAIGVALSYRAARLLGLDRGDRLAAAALCATAPAVVFQATIVEIHGVFYAFVGLTWCAAARFAESVCPRRALTLGAATGLAASVHASGHLLPGLCLLFALARGRREPGGPGLVGLVVRVGLAHVLVCTAFAFAASEGPPFADQLQHLVGDSRLERASVAGWSSALWNEWLWPYFPLSVVAIVAPFLRAERALAGVAVLGWLAYFILMTPMLIAIRAVERGAYHLPLVLPLAVLAVRLAPRRVAWVLVLLSIGSSVFEVRRNDVVLVPDRFAHDLLATQKHAPFVVTVSEDEIAAIQRVDATVHCLNIARIAEDLGSFPGTDDERSREVWSHADFFALDRRRRGRAIVLTFEAHRVLTTGIGPRWLRFPSDFADKYELRPIARGTFRGFRIEARRE